MQQNKTFKEAKARYNDLMERFGLEFLTIGTDFSENTEGWNIRDMVSECQYQLDVCYEEGNANSDGRYIEQYMDMYGSDEKEAEYVHKEWLSKTRRLRNFIKKYKDIALTEICVSGHCSKFD